MKTVKQLMEEYYSKEIPLVDFLRGVQVDALLSAKKEIQEMSEERSKTLTYYNALETISLVGDEIDKLIESIPRA